MREILLRGKRKDSGEWAEGNLFIPDLLNTPTQICIGTNVIRITYDVIPETVGQYTGLTDKNDKKIFEGDILEICQSKVGKYKAIVCWGNEWEKSAFILSYRGTAWDYLKVLNDPFKHIKSYEVIGNIHDNPELLNN